MTGAPVPAVAPVGSGSTGWRSPLHRAALQRCLAPKLFKSPVFATATRAGYIKLVLRQNQGSYNAVATRMTTHNIPHSCRVHPSRCVTPYSGVRVAPDWAIHVGITFMTGFSRIACLTDGHLGICAQDSHEYVGKLAVSLRCRDGKI
jgi:hypothetical protein